MWKKGEKSLNAYILVHTEYDFYVVAQQHVIIGGRFAQKETKLAAVLKTLNWFGWNFCIVMLDIKYSNTKNFSFEAEVVWGVMWPRCDSLVKRRKNWQPIWLSFLSCWGYWGSYVITGDSLVTKTSKIDVILKQFNRFGCGFGVIVIRVIKFDLIWINFFERSF